MSRTNGPKHGTTPVPAQEPEQQRGDGRAAGADEHARRRAGTEREAREFTEQTGYQPSRNQGRHEPMPASRHDDGPQGATVQNEASGSGQVRATPSRRAERHDRG